MIHQTWKNNTLSPMFKASQQSWRSMNPEFTYRFYTDRDCLRFIKKHFPQYIGLYKSLCLGVQRSDVFRYLVLYHYGGYYADMDTTCKIPIDTWMRQLTKGKDQVDCIVGEDDVVLDPDGTGFGTERHEYLQWFIASVPNHPLLLEVVDNIEARLEKRPCDEDNSYDEEYTLWLTGPGVFTDTIKSYRKYPQFMNIEVVAPCYFGNCSTEMSQIYPKCQEKAYLQHHYAGTWRNHSSIVEGFDLPTSFQRDPNKITPTLMMCMVLLVICVILIYMYHNN